MTIVPMAEAARRLGIDAKTLHRWLAEEGLALQPHPADARKKGLSSEQLHLLAQRHQRRLTPLPSEMPPLPAALLALPERLDAVQSQLEAVQQQVAELTRLLEQQAPAPVSPAPAAQPRRRSSPPARPAPRARAAAKTPRKPVHVIPRVEYVSEGRYVVICPKQGILPFELETPEWFAWVAEQSSFRFVGKAGHFSAHHEARVPTGAWRAHRHIRNHVRIQRLAPSQDLTMAVLEQAAGALQAYLK